ncbi:MAG: hypothetical protein ACREER_02835 [Alphaproteobacteria bacterium]
MAKTVDVLKGQRYCNADAPYIVWVVHDLVNYGVAVPHVRLRRVGDPFTLKTVSVSAVRDPLLYRFIGEASEGEAA